MKKIVCLIFACALALVPTTSYAHHRKDNVPITRAEYNTVQIGWVKRDVEAYFNNSGYQTAAWSDSAGSSIQKEYLGQLTADQPTCPQIEALINYLWTPNVGWVVEYKDLVCVGQPKG